MPTFGALLICIRKLRTWLLCRVNTLSPVAIPLPLASLYSLWPPLDKTQIQEKRLIACVSDKCLVSSMQISQLTPKYNVVSNRKVCIGRVGCNTRSCCVLVRWFS
ncbi:hypothetical protein IQ07DRAFT_433048 [Pyrenochaeta sp. DS3sAY3a]|nr:hypothetical protein IQ07DRAFT_433048 [Pyrenochaeta sp. DS3sAY3a]